METRKMDAKPHNGFLQSPQQHLRARQGSRDRQYTLQEMICVAVKGSAEQDTNALEKQRKAPESRPGITAPKVNSCRRAGERHRW